MISQNIHLFGKVSISYFGVFCKYFVKNCGSKFSASSRTRSRRRRVWNQADRGDIHASCDAIPSLSAWIKNKTAMAVLFFGGVVGVKTEPRHRGMKFGLSLHTPDAWGRQLAAGGGVGVKTEPRHRGMKFGLSLHTPDAWGRQLAAGGLEGSRTPVRKPLDMTFSGCILFFLLPVRSRQQTDCSLR